MTAPTATAVTDGHPHEEGGTCACPNVGRMGPQWGLGIVLHLGRTQGPDWGRALARALLVAAEMSARSKSRKKVMLSGPVSGPSI